MSLRHAILGFLALEPTTGYTLRQRFEGSVGSFWTATQSQIYRDLHALEREGLVEIEVVPQDGKPPRKIYTPTEEGRRALQAWLREPPGPTQLRDPFLLKLVFAGDEDPEMIDGLLARYGHDLAALAQEYRERRHAEQIFALARNELERVLWGVCIDNGSMWCEAQIAWVEKARAALREVAAPARPRPAAGRAKKRRS